MPHPSPASSPRRRLGLRATLLSVLCACLLPAQAHAQDILVYGPGGTLSVPFFPAGASTTVADEATWRGFSAGDFAAFDLIWIEGDNCSSADIQRAARETQGTWGGAVDGRTVFMTGDVDFHVNRNDGRAREFVGRLVEFTTAEGGTALMLNMGCTASVGTADVSDWAPAIGTPLTQATRDNYNASRLDDHPLTTGFTLAELSWGNTCHGSIASFPTDFTPVLGRAGDECILVREALPVCGDGVIEGAETCDDGDVTPGDGCSATCAEEPGYDCFGAPSVCTPVCGDGTVIAPETCDDGDTTPGDGCSATCAEEPGYDCVGAPSTCTPVCGDGMVIAPESCDDGDTTPGDGCSATCATEPGYVCSGMPSMCMPDCGDGMVIAPETCDDGGTAPGDGCSATCTTEPGSVCTGMPSVCGPCADTMAGDATDLGCTAMAPFCIGSGASAFCAPCEDDSAGIDLGCADPTRVCDTSAAPVHVCVACEDSVAGSGIDNGCVAARPLCGTTMGGAPTCVECVVDDDCGVGTVCSMTGECVPGCTEPADCTAANPVCDTSMRMCVECLEDSQCRDGQVCRPTRTCGAGDTDDDMVPDDEDDDDDNDGIPDVAEIDSALVGDSNGNGILDYEDALLVTCPDAGGDGVCDELPSSLDLDGDGIPNHLDLDADADGIADIVEGGGVDGDRDGLVDGFMDGDGDGLHDPYLASPLPTPSTDGDASPDFLDRDADGDGIPDTLEGGAVDADADGVADETGDGNGDGLADALTGAGAVPTPDTDGDGAPDYQDVDTDGDGIPDATEGTDADEDGEPDVAPAGVDTDGDGLDDAFDPSCADAADCAGVLGMAASLPDADGTVPDWRDVDSDGDGITDAVECPRPDACVDSDADGSPDYLSTDADGDGLPDATEGHDVESDGTADVTPSGVDTDGDGLDDAFDGDCAASADCGGVIGVVAPTPDLDDDGLPNFQDPDDDNDGLTTAMEREDADEYTGPAADPGDIDEDGAPNWYDTDTDGDTASDRTEGDEDEDDNGILDYMDPNYAPLDTDEDSVPDRDECPAPTSPAAGDCRDTDMDGTPDYQDPDDDGDGIPTADEETAGPDSDGDGVPNRLDLDSDDDGILDATETGADTDGDGIPDAYDLDADADGILDVFEGGGASFDTDGDGRIDGSDDENDNGVIDAVDATASGTALPVPDTDGDSTPDFQDVDADGDGVPDATEGHDTDADGTPDVTASGTDTNRDGLDDAYDPTLSGTAATLPDFDGDETPDFRDVDDDGDTVPTADELGDGGADNPWDTDEDGRPDYLDTDDDDDGLPTATEVADGNALTPPDDDVDDDGLTNWRDPDADGDGVDDGDEPDDADENGVPDYLEAPGDGMLDPGGLSGGALCSATPAGGNPGALFLLFLAALGLVLRRRKLGAALAVGLAVAVSALASPALAQQPSAVLNRYAAAETVEDDWALSRPTDFGHLRFGAQLQVDYAFNPLVFEGNLGMSDTEAFPVVEHQLTGTVNVAFGLFDRLVLFAGLPVTLVMDGDDTASAGRGIAPADGAGLSDMVLGARGRLLGEDDDFGALGLQLSATLPTAAPSPAIYRGEDHVTFLAELLGELRPGAGSRVVLNVGVRLRDEDAMGSRNIEFRHELTYGLGFAIPVWTDASNEATHLDLGAQLYGSTAFAYAFEREHSPMEAIGGAKFFHESGIVAGLSGGLGLIRGFGSPDLRMVAMFGWAMPEESPHPDAQPGDRDGDGILDGVDECLDEPEDVDTFEDENGCPDPDNDGDGILDSVDECPLEPENQNDWQDADGCPDEIGDADEDGILDNVDQCPSEPEDIDEHEDENGCPDPDNDGDGVLDTADQCRDEPGVIENRGCPDADRDGDTVVDRMDNCPDEPGTVENHGCAEEQQVVLREGRLEILDRVFFRTNRATIQRRSNALLMNVARVLNAHPEITRVVVEGHTDSRGRAEYNRRLSQQRAEAVVRFLTRRGRVEASRLDAQGFGPDRPIVEDASTPEQHAENRRVEFRIPEGSGIQQQSSGPGADTIDR